MKKRFLSVLLCLCLVVGMLPTITPTAQAAGTGVIDRLNSLRTKYPNGAYWNHYVSRPGQDCDSLSAWDETYANSVTNTACAHHGDGYSGNYVGLYDCNRFDGGSQCWGFACKIFYDVFGVKCSTLARDYTSANIKPGDYVRFGTDLNGHSAVVLTRNGDNFTIVECNFGTSAADRCQIKWGRQVTISGGSLGWKIAYCIHAPQDVYDRVNGSATTPSVNLGNDFYAYIKSGVGNVYLANQNSNAETARANILDPRQMWQFIWDDSRRCYKIISLYDGRCLNVDYGNYVNGSDVRLYDDNGDPAERWRLKRDNGDVYWIMPYASDLHLDVAGGYSTPGTNVQLYADIGSGNVAQKFEIIKIPNISSVLPRYANNGLPEDFYAEISYNGVYFETSGTITESGKNMDVLTSHTRNSTDPKQIWHFIRQNDGSYKIKNEFSGNWILDVMGANAGNGVTIRMWYDDSGHACQKWYLVNSPGENSYRVLSALGYPGNRYSIDLHNADGAKVQLWQQNANSWQWLNITPISYTKPAPPSAPTNIRVSATPERTKISWSAVPEVSSFDKREYQVILWDSNDNLVKSWRQTGTYYTYDNLSVGSYFVMIRAINTKYPISSSNYSSAYTTQTFTVRPFVSITLSAFPAEGGKVYGAGTDYQDGNVTTIQAVPNDGYHFVEWRHKGGTSYSNQPYLTFTVAGALDLEAVFEQDAPPTPNQYTIQVSADPSGGGDVTGGGTYTEGTSITVTATAKEGHRFVNWTEADHAVSSDASYSFTVTDDRNLTAIFEEIPVDPDPEPTKYTVALNASLAAGGTVTGGGSYAENTSITVTAVPNSGYQFEGWQENGSLISSNARYTFTVSENRTLIAIFKKNEPPTCAITAVATAGGSVSGSGVYKAGVNVTLTATPNSGYRFVSWTENGNVVNESTTYTFMAEKDRTVTAVFEAENKPGPTKYIVQVIASPSEGGTVTGGGQYTGNETITISATPNAGYHFVKWENRGTVSTDPIYKFMAGSNLTFTAVFEANTPEPTQTYTIAVSTSSAEQGSVTGGGSFERGSLVTISATPNDGYQFVEWQLNGQQISTTASYTFTANDNHTFTAVFQERPQAPDIKTYSINVSTAGGGTVSGSGLYVENGSVTIRATHNSGYQFVEWLSDGRSVSTSDSYTFTATEDKSFIAVFEQRSDPPAPPVSTTYTIRVSADPAGGGTVSGGGNFKEGTSVTVTAAPNSGYRFTGWTENGYQVSTDSSYTFTISADRTFTAQFTSTGGSSSGNHSSSSSPGSSSSSRPSTKPSTTTPIPVSTSKTPSSGATTTAAPSVSAKDNVATSVITSEIADEIIKQAVSNDSGHVVIAPDIKGDAAKVTVTVPSSVLNEIKQKTDAGLIFSSPLADIAFTNSGLSDASGQDTVTITTKRAGNSLEVSVAIGNQTVKTISGGAILTVPITQGASGTVAVLINDDGTRQVIRKSVANESMMTVPVDGSARLEIINNAKNFADVPVGNWATDAVAFVSAHELFNGTSDNTFSPDLPMTRGMLAVVLHNLENNPKQDFSAAFSDVAVSAWYSNAVIWAAGQNIVSGYGNRRFGPNDKITREQLAVMLWRYAGMPTPNSKELWFSDADQVGSFALDAICWAVENGVINGKGNGTLDPKGFATRAQVAQILRNYLKR